MNQDELDRILSEHVSEHTGIVPSSGFVSGVMDAVRREASTPPPIPFPWIRALPALAAAAFVLGTMIVVLLRSSSAGVTPTPSIASRVAAAIAAVVETATMYGVGWILLAIALTVVSISLSMRLAARRAGS